MSIRHVTSSVEHISILDPVLHAQVAKVLNAGHQGWFLNEPTNLTDAVGLSGVRNERRDFVMSKAPSRSKLVG